MMVNALVRAAFLNLALTVLSTAQASEFVRVIAERYPTPGLAGFYTYDLIAETNEGYFNGFDFEPGGVFNDQISGPLYQSGGVFTTDPSDTGWLVDRTTGLIILHSESDTHLYGMYVYTGSGGERNTYSTWAFARIVTEAPEDVLVRGTFLITPSGGEDFLANFSSTLGDIQLIPEPTGSALIAAILCAGASGMTCRKARVCSSSNLNSRTS